jgi:hypothetical protein
MDNHLKDKGYWKKQMPFLSSRSAKRAYFLSAKT